MEKSEMFDNENLPLLDEIKTNLLGRHEGKDTDADLAEARWVDNYSHQFEVISGNSELLERYKNAAPADRQKIIDEIDQTISSLEPKKKK